MKTRGASVRLLSLALGAAAALILALGAERAAAQVQIPGCIAPDLVPEAVFDGVDAEYDLAGTPQDICEDIAKAAVAGCKKAVATAAKCRNLVHKAALDAQLLACAAIADAEARKACESDAKAALKSLDDETKEQKKAGSESCPEVGTAVLSVCAEE